MRSVECKSVDEARKLMRTYPIVCAERDDDTPTGVGGVTFTFEASASKSADVADDHRVLWYVRRHYAEDLTTLMVLLSKDAYTAVWDGAACAAMLSKNLAVVCHRLLGKVSRRLEHLTRSDRWHRDQRRGTFRWRGGGGGREDRWRTSAPRGRDVGRGDTYRSRERSRSRSPRRRNPDALQ